MDWREGLTNIHQRLLYLYNFSMLSDVSIVIVDDGVEKVFKVHSVILGMISPVFERMFSNENFEKNRSIVIKEVGVELFDIFLRFIYTEEVKFSSVDEAWSLFYLGDKYMIPELKELCMPYIKKNITPSNACISYEMAKVYDLSDLSHKCKQVIIEKTSEVLAEPNFMMATEDTVFMLLDQCKINAREIDLFVAIINWVNHKMEDKEQSMISSSSVSLVTKELENTLFQKLGNSSTQDDTIFDADQTVEDETLKATFTVDLSQKESEDSVDKCLTWNETSLSKSDVDECEKTALLKKVLSKIYFSDMMAEEFATKVMNANILTTDESLGIIMNLVSKGTVGSWPSRFRKCKRENKDHINEGEVFRLALDTNGMDVIEQESWNASRVLKVNHPVILIGFEIACCEKRDDSAFDTYTDDMQLWLFEVSTGKGTTKDVMQIASYGSTIRVDFNVPISLFPDSAYQVGIHTSGTYEKRKGHELDQVTFVEGDIVFNLFTAPPSFIPIIGFYFAKPT
ncbi:uncharacterized protein LOC106662185 isoform X2 [Cimex lectularius]|uniref:BTB domain-containing protein n=1 Tax=Cimex lectularius TaxID=79782 RepID=A0A8I6RAD4_CIMLE|nr:uncharacterized protein LOC106662185 isoform X2 [Cimex lectularius]